MTTDIHSAQTGPIVAPQAAAQDAVPTGDSGFGKVPTRIRELAPIVVDGEPDATTRAAVVETLQQLGEKVASVHRTAAEAYIAQSMYAEAMPHLEAAATFAPDNLEYRNQVGFVSFLAGDDAKSIAAFDHVLSIEPNQVDALFNLGMVQFGQENFIVAASCFERVLAITPQDPEVWNNMGACLVQAGRVEDGVGCFQKTLSIDPSNEDARANLAALGR